MKLKFLCCAYPLYAFAAMFLLTGKAHSQDIYTPATVNTSFLHNASGKLEKEHKDVISHLPKENRDMYKEIYGKRWANIKSKFEEKEVYTAPAAQKYIDSMLTAIVQTNPLLQGREIHAYFSRSALPNASYIGQGVILFNMGLFRQLKTESQAAFVLCHELAHYYLHHNENSIKKYVTDINSKSVQQQLKKIKKEKYRKQEHLEELNTLLKFDSRRHSRDHESEADSLGLEFLHNSHFNTADALSALALLDTIDNDSLDIKPCLEKMFRSKSYPFQPRWLAKSDLLLGGHAQLLNDHAVEDSLKTHPDCKVRINVLAPAVAEYSRETNNNGINPAMFEKLKKEFSYETIEYAYANNNYTSSLYQTITLLQEQPEDAYLICQTGKILNSCYQAQKQHHIGDKIAMPAPGNPDSYNLLAQFIRNLYLEDYARISNSFLEQYNARLNSYPVFQKEMAISISYVQP
ncbi:M48 family metalloprotease [Chitinophaga sp. RCC_12]|uniref:M48 family metalloprotease n=1 Tax=Chitinophaga sp. RCC_12 TaxID=3239226 RepID=UPI0035234B68